MPPSKDPIDIDVDVELRDGQKIVGIQFNKKISWFGLTADEGEEFANFILGKVRQIREAPTERPAERPAPPERPADFA